MLAEFESVDVGARAALKGPSADWQVLRKDQHIAAIQFPTSLLPSWHVGNRMQAAIPGIVVPQGSLREQIAPGA